ncbi:hypothetical protein IMSAGC004_01835 [Bacteroidaceae bacterium]|nr:hypothetical protein IMSAGC004_01835 [Bacteroidaceae bacterium]
MNLFFVRKGRGANDEAMKKGIGKQNACGFSSECIDNAILIIDQKQID